MKPLITLPAEPVSVAGGWDYYKVSCPACSARKFSFRKDNCNHKYNWGCETCGTPWEIVVGDSLQDITFAVDEKSLERSKTIRGYCLLTYTGGGLPNYIVVEGTQYRSKNDDDETVRHHQEYFYREHTCPTNFLGVERVVLNGDTDPHGIYEFVEFVSSEDICKKLNLTYTELAGYDFNNGSHGNHGWEDIFPQLMRTDADDPQVQMPWNVAMGLLRLYMVDRLVKLGHLPDEAASFLQAHQNKPHYLLQDIYKDLVAELSKSIPKT